MPWKWKMILRYWRTGEIWENLLICDWSINLRLKDGHISRINKIERLRVPIQQFKESQYDIQGANSVVNKEPICFPTLQGQFQYCPKIFCVNYLCWWQFEFNILPSRRNSIGTIWRRKKERKKLDSWNSEVESTGFDKFFIIHWFSPSLKCLCS